MTKADASSTPGDEGGAGPNANTDDRNAEMLARKQREWPAYRDFASRSFTTELDCSDVKRDLGFQPESDRGRFLSRIFDQRR